MKFILEIVVYSTKNKKEPFNTWFEKLDKKVKSLIITRLHRLQNGNFGDCKLIKGCKGLWELRMHDGPGYRVYFGRDEETIVVLLLGGNKQTQNSDIEKSVRYWFDYKEQKNG